MIRVSTRRSVYFRPVKDKDLNDYVNKLLQYHDFSEIARGLMRDGIKFREGIHSNKHLSMSEPHINNNQNSSESANIPSNPTPIPDIKLNKIEVSEDVLKSRLDGF